MKNYPYAHDNNQRVATMQNDILFYTKSSKSVIEILLKCFNKIARWQLTKYNTLSSPDYAAVWITVIDLSSHAQASLHTTNPVAWKINSPTFYCRKWPYNYRLAYKRRISFRFLTIHDKLFVGAVPAKNTVLQQQRYSRTLHGLIKYYKKPITDFDNSEPYKPNPRLTR